MKEWTIHYIGDNGLDGNGADPFHQRAVLSVMSYEECEDKIRRIEEEIFTLNWNPRSMEAWDIYIYIYVFENGDCKKIGKLDWLLYTWR